MFKLMKPFRLYHKEYTNKHAYTDIVITNEDSQEEHTVMEEFYGPSEGEWEYAGTTLDFVRYYTGLNNERGIKIMYTVFEYKTMKLLVDVDTTTLMFDTPKEAYEFVKDEYEHGTDDVEEFNKQFLVIEVPEVTRDEQTKHKAGVVNKTFGGILKTVMKSSGEEPVTKWCV